MVKRIINIAIFAVGIIAIALAIVFVGKWNGTVANDDSAKEKANVDFYKAIGVLQTFDDGQQLLDGFLNADTKAIGTTKSPGAYTTKISEYVAKKDAECKVSDDNAKKFYGYLNVLKAVKEADFATFSANYPQNILSLTENNEGKTFTFGKQYVQEFKGIKSYEELNNYITGELSQQYTEYKTAQLTEQDHLNAVKKLQLATDSVANVSAFDQEKKQQILSMFQNNFQSYRSMDHGMITPSFVMIYIMFGVALVAVVLFILVNIISNFKTSYVGLLAFVALLLVMLIAYLCAQPDVNNLTFAKLSISPAEGRFIEACCYIVYILGGAAILAAIFCPIASIVRSNIKLK